MVGYVDRVQCVQRFTLFTPESEVTGGIPKAQSRITVVQYHPLQPNRKGVQYLLVLRYGKSLQL